MLTDLERSFVEAHPVARLATADAEGVPHVVPICFVVLEDTLYLSIDEKPKQDARRLKRLRNIAANNQVAVVVDHYDDDWSQLGWVMLRGPAEIIETLLILSRQFLAVLLNQIENIAQRRLCDGWKRCDH